MAGVAFVDQYVHTDTCREINDLIIVVSALLRTPMTDGVRDALGLASQGLATAFREAHQHCQRRAS